MAELKVYLSEDLDRQFRRIAMAVYGYGRGSISKAAVDALTKWCRSQEASWPESTSPVASKDELHQPGDRALDNLDSRPSQVTTG